MNLPSDISLKAVPVLKNISKKEKVHRREMASLRNLESKCERDKGSIGSWHILGKGYSGS